MLYGTELFAALIVGHLIADYPLQGDFIAKAKNASAPIPGVPWQTILASHAFMHGGAVWLLTGSLWLGAAETIAHAGIDHLKCTGRLGVGARAFNIDQALHVACKAAWVLIAGAFQ